MHPKLKKSDESDVSDQSDRSEFFDEPLRAALQALRTAPAETCANIMLCLSHQASFLLGRQLQRLEADFVAQGGFTERLYRYRKEQRDAGRVKEQDFDWSDQSDQNTTEPCF